MAQKNRPKNIWLIPKRVNLHQTICLIDGILQRKYDKTSWNPQKQNNLGVNLKRWGATKNGKNISSQAVRTLVASIPQYLGFLYINKEGKSNTICLTEAGRALWERHKSELVKVPNLLEGGDLLITESPAVLKQMEKLQITNPVINKDCENIQVFPFRLMLKLLMKVDYLDQEEIAYFLFKVRRENEVAATVQAIQNFRELSLTDREALINTFKATHIGNITLKQASSAGYFISLCHITGILDRYNEEPKNRNGAITALRIKEKCKEYVKDMLHRYENAEVYDFGDNLQLWMDYMGDPARDYPPINVSVINKDNNRFLVLVFKDGVCQFGDLIERNGVLEFPMFVNEGYDIKVIDTTTGDELKTLHITPSFEHRECEIEEVSDVTVEAETLEDVAQEIIEHCEANTFAGKTLNYLNIVSKVTGVDKTGDKSLRGAYFEYFVYKMLLILKSEKVIDEVTWNGRKGKYGLPVPAPGGKSGTPDLVFVIDDLHIVVELTTIKPKSLQFSAEGSSVPDHIRLYQKESGMATAGVFCAPLIHERNTAPMQSTIAPYGIELHCITDKELVALLLTRDREKIKNIKNF